MNKLIRIYALLLLAPLVPLRAAVVADDASPCPPKVADALARLQRITASGAPYEQILVNAETTLAFLTFEGLKSSAASTAIRAAILSTAGGSNMRALLLEAAGLIRDGATLASVGQICRNFGEPLLVRRSALHALGTAGKVSSFDDIAYAAQNDPDPGTRAMAVLELRGIGNPAVNAEMVASAQKWLEKHHLKGRGIEALFKPSAVLDGGRKAALKNIFRQALAHSHYQVRMAGAQGLYAWGDVVDLGTLFQAFDFENSTHYAPSTEGPGSRVENKVVKIKIITAIAKIGGAAATQGLADRFNTEYDPDVVAAMLDAFGALGGATAFVAVSQTISSGNEFYVLHAAKAAATMDAVGLLPAIRARQSSATDIYTKTILDEAIRDLEY